MEVNVGKLYRHFKGNEYKVIAIGYDSESNNDEELKKLVIYEDVLDRTKVWVRPYDMFVSKVDKIKYPDVKQEYRFEEIK
ncbi:MAG: DUF1653 domain-containing protein [Tenericutes bacterium]|nr:DUF1653 domain-containing protein [Mycoplasmatota bacterium]